MDFKFTFADGSEAIAHYGVKGMKWGVWNSATRDRYLGVTKSPTRSIYEDALSVNRPRQDQGHLSISVLSGEKYDPIVQRGTNCACCGLAYEMRRRGYDVQAGLSDAAANIAFGDAKSLGTFFSGAEYNSASGVSDLASKLSSMPDGSRGILYGITTGGAEHVINWEVSGGTVIYVDGQNQRVYTEEELRQIYPAAYPAEYLEKMEASGKDAMTYVRTDNLDADVDALNRYAAIRPSSESEKETAQRTMNASFAYALNGSLSAKERAFYIKRGISALSYMMTG